MVEFKEGDLLHKILHIIISILKWIFNQKICNKYYILKCCIGQRIEQTYSYDHAHIASKF